MIKRPICLQGPSLFDCNSIGAHLSHHHTRKVHIFIVVLLLKESRGGRKVRVGTSFSQ